MKERVNKIPKPRTIAKHYAQGRYCDYPADILFEAVNSYPYDYNPTAIPIQLGFKQIFIANFDAFVYLSEHRSQEEIEAFVADPNGFMSKAGVKLLVPFDAIAPKIFIALAEDEMLEALHDSEGLAVGSLLVDTRNCGWSSRHPERYSKGYMHREFAFLENVPEYFDKESLNTNGYDKVDNILMDINLERIARFFSADDE